MLYVIGELHGAASFDDELNIAFSLIAVFDAFQCDIHISENKGRRGPISHLILSQTPDYHLGSLVWVSDHDTYSRNMGEVGLVFLRDHRLKHGPIG